MSTSCKLPQMEDVESSREKENLDKSLQSNFLASEIPILSSTSPVFFLMRTKAIFPSLFQRILLPTLVITSFLLLSTQNIKFRIPTFNTVSVKPQPRIRLLESPSPSDDSSSPSSLSALEKPLKCVKELLNSVDNMEIDDGLKDVVKLSIERLTVRNRELYIESHHHESIIQSAEDIHVRLKKYGQCGTRVKLPKVAMCAIQQGASSFIQEWMSFYLLHGVTKIFMYDNSFPGTVEYGHFREAMRPFVESGYADIQDWFGKDYYQLKAYNECLEKARDSYDWVAFFDVDEYMIVNAPGPVCIPEFLLGYQEYPGLQIRWRMFTPRGVTHHNSSQLFLEQYKWTTYHVEGKSIAQTKYALKMRTNPHLLRYKDGLHAVCPDKKRCNFWDTSPEPYKYVELRHYWGVDWQYTFYQKLCSGSKQNTKIMDKRINILVKWFKDDCCSKLEGKTRQEIVLRKFLLEDM